MQDILARSYYWIKSQPLRPHTYLRITHNAFSPPQCATPAGLYLQQGLMCSPLCTGSPFRLAAVEDGIR